jgi:adenylate cyclase
MATAKGSATLDLEIVQTVFSHRLQQADLERILHLLSVEDRDELLTKVGELLGRVSALVEVSHRVHDTLSLDILLPRLMAIVTEALDADRSSLFLYDDRTDELYSRVAQGAETSELRFPAGAGVAGSVFRSNRATLIDDAYADKRFNREIDQRTGYHTRNIICAPITNNGTPIGVTQVLNKRNGSFSDEDLILLQALGAQAASALANAQLYERAEEARAEQDRLIELTKAISTELQLDTLLEKIVQVATDILHADRSTLFLHDPRTSELWSRIAQGMETTEIRFPDTMGIAGTSFTNCETINIPDPYADPRFNQEVDRKTGYRTQNILCMPILSKDGHAIGVMQVLNKKRGPFNEVDESRLRAFASQASVALENARLFEEVLNARNYNESILRSLTNAVVTLDTDDQVIKINEAARRILRMEPSEFVGKSLRKTLGPHNPWLLASLGKVARSGRSDLAVDATLRFSDDEDDSVSVNVTVVPMLDIHHEPIGTMLVAEDIGKEKRLRSTMARYMTKEVADRLLEEGESTLGGASQEVTILFSDIRDFTPMAERLGPRETVTMLNDYFSEMVDVVFQHGGILDKYIGDAIMALFGAPFPTGEDADRAVAVANDMMRALADHNSRRMGGGRLPIRIGIGISTGEVIVGNIGSPRRMDYTVIGDSVNLASRLEAANKYYGTSILICERAAAQLQREARLREIELLRVKGKLNPVSIYEVLDYHHGGSFPHLDQVLSDFERGVAAYRKRQFNQALSHFETVLNAHPVDGPALVYRERCEMLMSNPPDDEWTPVRVLMTK